MSAGAGTAMPDPGDDFDELLRVVLPFARQTLQRYGELAPFGAAIDVGGEVQLLAIDSHEGAVSGPELVHALTASVRRDRDAFRSTALVADVLWQGADAVRVELEHRDGRAALALLPYTSKRFRRGVAFGELSTHTGRAQVWST